jgi:hypothetical protein
VSTNLSVKDVLAKLEAQYALHQEREAFHALQEVHHREQRALHAGEMETLARNLEAFRNAAEAAVGLASRATVRLPKDEKVLDIGRRGLLTRLITRVLEDKEGDQRFGILGVTEEVNRRFAEMLRSPADPRQVSVVLRRFARLGRIHLVRRGRPHHEALYARESG